MQIKGQGVGAMMNMKTTFDLADAGAGTLMKWAADVKIAGPVGAMGQRVLQPVINQQVQHVLGALDEQVQQAKGSAGSSSGSSDASGTSPAPSTAAQAPPAEGPKDYGRPADADADPEPDTGTSGADEGISPISDEPYEQQ